MNKTDKIVVLEEYKSNAEKEKTRSEALRKEDVTVKAKAGFLLRGLLKKLFTFDKRQLLLKAIGVVVAIPVVLLFLGFIPFFQVTIFEVDGNLALTDEKVSSLAEIGYGDNIFFVNTRAAERNLRKSPFVEEVDVQREFPNKVTVQLVERRSVGYIVTSDGYVQVGEDGRLLAIQQSLSNYGLPVISGIELKDLPAIGGFIQNKKLKQALSILQSCDQSLLDNIAELNVGQEHYIIAYTNQKVEVRLGGLENIEKRLQDLNQILTVVVGRQIAVDQILYIDMRYEGQPVIKLRT